MLGHYCIKMASIYEVADVIGKITEGFNREVLNCMDENKGIIRGYIREQLYSGLDGTDHLIKPTYDDDPFFKEEGQWHNNAKGYKKWKMDKTPPVESQVLHLPPRPEEVPNLYITGAFYDSITITKKRVRVAITSDGFVDGDAIIRKYKKKILKPGTRAKEKFVEDYLKPHLKRFFRSCGLK